MENNALNLSKTLPICKETLAKILRFAIVDKRLTELSVRVLTYICIYCDDTSVTNNDICEILGISHRETIAKIWKNLIDTNWIVRTPKINPATGKHVKGFLYRISIQNLNTSSNKQTTKSCSSTQNTSVHHKHTKLPKDSVIRDSTHINNKDIIHSTSTINNNTPYIPLTQDEFETLVITIAKKINQSFSEKECSSIYRWILRLAEKRGSKQTQNEIITIINRLSDYYNDGVDIVKLIADSVESPWNYLIKPSKLHIRDIENDSQKNDLNPKKHRFNNPKYLDPINEGEEYKVASKIATWYSKSINPKNMEPMTETEINTIKEHNQLCLVSCDCELESRTYLA